MKGIKRTLKKVITHLTIFKAAVFNGVKCCFLRLKKTLSQLVAWLKAAPAWLEPAWFSAFCFTKAGSSHATSELYHI